jgi:hypothetical protein
LRPREKHGVVKAINKRCSKDFQAAVDGYCKFWVKLRIVGELLHGRPQLRFLKKLVIKNYFLFMNGAA